MTMHAGTMFLYVVYILCIPSIEVIQVTKYTDLAKKPTDRVTIFRWWPFPRGGILKRSWLWTLCIIVLIMNSKHQSWLWTLCITGCKPLQVNVPSLTFPQAAEWHESTPTVCPAGSFGGYWCQRHLAATCAGGRRNACGNSRGGWSTEWGPAGLPAACSQRRPSVNKPNVMPVKCPYALSKNDADWRRFKCYKWNISKAFHTNKITFLISVCMFKLTHDLVSEILGTVRLERFRW